MFAMSMQWVKATAVNHYQKSILTQRDLVVVVVAYSRVVNHDQKSMVILHDAKLLAEVCSSKVGLNANFVLSPSYDVRHD